VKKRVTSTLDADVAGEVRDRAAEMGISVSSVLQRALLDFFRDTKPVRGREASSAGLRRRRSEGG